MARALEGREHRGAPYVARMRAEDHQLLTPLVVSVMQRLDSGGIRQDVEGSGYGFRTERHVPLEAATRPSACRMVRPR